MLMASVEKASVLFLCRTSEDRRPLLKDQKPPGNSTRECPKGSDSDIHQMRSLTAWTEERSQSRTQGGVGHGELITPRDPIMLLRFYEIMRSYSE